MRMWVVAHELKIVEVEIENIFFVGVDYHLREIAGFTGELQVALIDVVVVDMSVAEGMDEIAVLEAAALSDHHGEECVGSDVEWDAEEDVGGALVELARETAVGDIELEEDVARREGHLRHFAHVPSGDEEATGVGVELDLADEVGDLVDLGAVGASPRAPLMAVDGAEVAIGVGPLVPDGDLVVVEVLDVGVALEEPEEFVDDGAEVKFFGSEERESIVEVEAHLVAESADGTGAGAVVFWGTVIEYVLKKVQVLFHDEK